MPDKSTWTGRYFGPGTLVAAAFVGPGTVTVCTLAGAHHGYSLLWALLFSILATLVLQEMAARLGWVTQEGLGSAIRRTFTSGWRRLLFFALVLGAIVVGNAAYQAGNIGGAVLGIEAVVGALRAWPVVIGVLAFLILYAGRYHLLERLLTALVLFMSLSFLATAVMLRPSLTAIAAGLIPQPMDPTATVTALALIGTTVVPYNLFLHSASVREKWGPGSSLGDVRIEGAVAIALGGLISMAIVVVSAASLQSSTEEISTAANIASQLEPLLGSWATVLMGMGLFAAGISSAITAPLAAALAARELFDWPRDLQHPGFRLVWGGVLASGMLFASLGVTPIALIRFAQAANGVLLPITATFLLVVVSRRYPMGEYRNRGWQTVVGCVVIGVTLLLSVRVLWSLFGG